MEPHDTQQYFGRLGLGPGSVANRAAVECQPEPKDENCNSAIAGHGRHVSA